MYWHKFETFSDLLTFMAAILDSIILAIENFFLIYKTKTDRWQSYTFFYSKSYYLSPLLQTLVKPNTKYFDNVNFGSHLGFSRNWWIFLNKRKNGNYPQTCSSHFLFCNISSICDIYTYMSHFLKTFIFMAAILDSKNLGKTNLFINI